MLDNFIVRIVSIYIHMHTHTPSLYIGLEIVKTISPEDFLASKCAHLYLLDWNILAGTARPRSEQDRSHGSVEEGE